MGSMESESLAEFYKNTSKMLRQNPNLPLQFSRAYLEELHTLANEPSNVTYEEVQCPGTVIPALWCKPLMASSKHVILYFHGGGFFAGSPYSYRKLVSHLAKAVGALALAIDYRRAPEHIFPAQLQDSTAAYDWLLSQGFPPENIAIAGDSAGGNLAITTVLKLRESKTPLPAAVVGFSPWVDIELRGESMDTNAASDIIVSRESLGNAAIMWLGGASPQEPLANPLYADFSGYPPMYLSVGGKEVLMSDAQRLADIIGQANGKIELEIVEGMQHVHVFMAGKAPEADTTFINVGKWIKPFLNL